MNEKSRKLSYNKESVLAVVGGGRWGRVILSVLAEMQLPFDRVVIVSNVNRHVIHHLIEHQHSLSCVPFNVVSSLDELLQDYDVKAGIVVNAARQHFDTSVRLIERGVSVLIEKPIALSIEDVETLLKLALSSDVCLVPGLQYRFCSYIHRFAKQLSLIGKKPHRFHMEWSDQTGETRYGEKKTYDPTINVAQDVMPHVWTILSTIFNHQHIVVDSRQIFSEGRRADFLVTTEEGVQGHIILERDSNGRRRFISLEFDTNENLTLDFTHEPGIISLNGKTFSSDPDWESQPKPLTRQLNYFLSAVENGVSAESDIQACLDSVSFFESYHDRNHKSYFSS